MKKTDYFIGIDISKLTLDVFIINKSQPKEGNHFKVSNNASGLKEMIQRITKQKIALDNCFFCCENTGVYTIPLVSFLSEKQLLYWVISGLEIKRSKGFSRGKTDKADAKDIAMYALTHLHLYKPNVIAEKEIQQLRLLITEREKLVKAIVQFEQTNENVGFIPKNIFSVIAKTNSKILTTLRKALKELELKMLSILESHNELNKKFQLLKSVKGIGPQTALYLLTITKGFSTFDNWRKMACYAGVAPFEYSSGTSVRGRTKVHHLADKKMKSMLQMCVLTAIKSDPEIKLYYKRKKDEGKNSMLIMNNIRCKLLARAFAVIKRGSPYVCLNKFAA